VNVKGFSFAIDLVEIFSVWILLGRTAIQQETPKALNCDGFILSRVLDARSFFDLNHCTSNPLQHYLVVNDLKIPGLQI